MIPVGWSPLKHYSLLELPAEVLRLGMMHNAARYEKKIVVFKVNIFKNRII